MDDDLTLANPVLYACYQRLGHMLPKLPGERRYIPMEPLTEREIVLVRQMTGMLDELEYLRQENARLDEALRNRGAATNSGRTVRVRPCQRRKT